MTTLALILIIATGLSLVVYTVQILSIIPLTNEEKILTRAFNVITYSFIDGAYQYTPPTPIKRYYMGGKWWRRSSWSNSPYGERGATVPTAYNTVVISAPVKVNIKSHPLKRFIYWIRKKKIIHNIYDLCLVKGGNVHINGEDLAIYGSLHVGDTVHVEGKSTLHLYGSNRQGRFVGSFRNDTGKDITLYFDEENYPRRADT